MRRELRRKPLNCLLDYEPTAALGGPDEQNSPVFSQLAGNLGLQRRVRSRLPPPAGSLVRTWPSRPNARSDAL